MHSRQSDTIAFLEKQMIADFIKTLIVFIVFAVLAQTIITLTPIGILIVFGFLVSLGFWGVFIEPNQLTVKSFAITVKDLPASLKGSKIALLGCLHAGCPSVGISKVKQVVDLINKQNPDLVFLLGDFLSNFVIGKKQVTPYSIASELSRITSKLGTFAVYGNHDIWRGKDEIRDSLQRFGIEILDNTCFSLPPTEIKSDIRIAGVGWEGDQLEAVKATFKAIPQDAFLIALMHSPDTFSLLPQDVSLAFASHTHGGQVRLPIIGALLVPCKTGSKYASGVFKEGNKQLVVTSGIGTSIIPVRLFCKPEIVTVTLE